MSAVLLARGDRAFVCSPGEELQTDLGVLEVPDDVEPGDVVETHLGEPFRVRRLRGPDLFRHLERTGAPMMPRDVGLLVGHLGIESGDRVLDVGTGTGVLAAYLGRLGATVVTYERNASFAEVARRNLETAGVSGQVEVRARDVLDDLGSLSGFDVLTLDTEDAPSVVAAGAELLDAGGVVGAYSPFVEDARRVVEAASQAGFAGLATYETLQREMDFDERGSRPSTAGVGHTGYLTVGRLD